MKAILIILLANLLLVGCVTKRTDDLKLKLIEKTNLRTKYSEKYTAYYDATGTAVKHGKYVMYWENGNKYVDTEYVRGLKNGKCVIYSENGQPILTGYYRNNEPWNGVFHYGHQIRKYYRGIYVKDVTDEYDN